MSTTTPDTTGLAAAPAPARPGGTAFRVLKSWPRLAGQSEAARILEDVIVRVASFDCPVLITGETGCGKEEVARAIHAAGPRRDKPFVSINCGGLVTTLAEGQLFGHEKGAFTGAVGSSLGGFRAAQGGVVFLDEIGEMPLELQPKLLQVLQRSEVTPLGSTLVHPIDVQVIAATNRDVEAQIDRGLFREDLFYRLNTVHITVPPLRSRTADIPAFIEHFARHFAGKYDRPTWRPEPELLDRLVAHPWPGNVRQLAQTIQRLYVFEDRRGWVLEQLLQPEGTAEDPEGTQQPAMEVPADGMAAGGGSAVAVAAGDAEPALPVFNLDTLRQMAVRQALRATNGHRGRAAKLLGVSLNTMTRMALEACPHVISKRGRKPAEKPRKPR